MNITREDVVQSALNIQRWCKNHYSDEECDCPFFDIRFRCQCMLPAKSDPREWNLEEKLRTRMIRRIK